MDSLPPINVHLTIGAVEIGVLVSYTLFGVTTVQAYIYYGRFPDDPSKLKALVALVWFCLLAQVIAIGHILYTFTITYFGQAFRIFETAPKSLSVGVFSGGIMAAAVQGFFAYRIYAFTKKLYIPILSWSLSFVRFLGSVTIFATTLRMTSFPTYAEQWGWLLTSVWCISAANDLTITASLVTNLIIQRSRIHKRTVPLIDKLIMWTIETGMVTSLTALAVMISFFTMPHNFIWFCLFISLPGLFSNSLLASLNSRTTLRAMNNLNSGSVPISTTLNFGTELPSAPRESAEQNPKRGAHYAT
ncbi:hypothetical protein DFH08DRAFT_453934 [Mycena albidolilacea]|uniref:DUF6534 domain-containing protein n=1 Tax=Mycena albidolilacea TaxID=1033008 RepID=A0AAD6Z7S7_9AGAR|nr:hypothetical protein DFH08DRAFT_453934 [Mycena albidolilacea]